MERTSYQASNCSIARTLQVVGEKWTLLILRESFYGATRFEQFHRVLQCPRNLLSERLHLLVDEGILERSEYREPGSRARKEYRLTDKGRELALAPARAHAVGRPPQGRPRRSARGRSARRVRPRSARHASRARRGTSSRSPTRSSSWTGRARFHRSRPEMAALRARVEVAALQTLLTGLGVLMALASRRVDRFRRQVTRDLLLEIRSDDGARQQYRLHAATRRLTLPRRPGARRGLHADLPHRPRGAADPDLPPDDRQARRGHELRRHAHRRQRRRCCCGSTGSRGSSRRSARRAARAARRRCRSAHPRPTRRGRAGSSASRRSASSAATGRRRGRRARSSCRSEPPTGNGCHRDERRRHRAQRARPRVASPPVGQGHDAGRLEQLRRAARVVGPRLERADVRVPAVRSGRERLRAAADVRGHAGVARGLHAHRARALRAAHDVLGGDRRARADRRGPERRSLSARVADLHPRAPARRLRAAGLDRQRRRALGPEPRPDRRRRQRLLPRLLQPAALGLRLRLGRHSATTSRSRSAATWTARSRGRSPSSPRFISEQLADAARGAALREHEDLAVLRQRDGPRAEGLRRGQRHAAALALRRVDGVRPAALHGPRPPRRPRVVRVLLRPDRAPGVHVPRPRDGARVAGHASLPLSPAPRLGRMAVRAVGPQARVEQPEGADQPVRPRSADHLDRADDGPRDRRRRHRAAHARLRRGALRAPARSATRTTASGSSSAGTSRIRAASRARC